MRTLLTAIALLLAGDRAAFKRRRTSSPRASGLGDASEPDAQ